MIKCVKIDQDWLRKTTTLTNDSQSLLNKIQAAFYKNLTNTELATLLEGAGLAFDIQKCLKFQKSNMAVLKL